MRIVLMSLVATAFSVAMFGCHNGTSEALSGSFNEVWSASHKVARNEAGWTPSMGYVEKSDWALSANDPIQSQFNQEDGFIRVPLAGSVWEGIVVLDCYIEALTADGSGVNVRVHVWRTGSFNIAAEHFPDREKRILDAIAAEVGTNRPRTKDGTETGVEP